MARPLREICPGFPHHVILRGNNRRCLFGYQNDYVRFAQLVDKALLKTNCRLHALVLLQNHVHLVVTPREAEDLPRFVKRCAQRYAQIRNGARAASGKLFEQRYWSKPIRSEHQLAGTIMYVDLNPVRAGLVTDPFDYRWSTFAIHGGQPQRSSIPLSVWSPCPWYLSLASNPADRPHHYLEAVARYRAHSKHEHPEYDPADVEPSITAYTKRIERPDRSSAR